MERFIQICHAAFALTGAAFFLVATYVVWQSRGIPLHVNGVLTRAEVAESKLTATLANLDKTSASGKAEADAIKDTTDQARLTLSSAQQTFDKLSLASDQLSTTIRTIQGTADAGTGLLSSAKGTVDKMPALVDATRDSLTGLVPVEKSASDTFSHLDALLSRPSLADAIDHLDQTSQNVALTTNDFQIRFHAVLFPPPCKTFGCKMEKWVIPALKEAPAFGQGLYWTRALFDNVKP